MATLRREAPPESRERSATEKLPPGGVAAQDVTAAPAAQRVIPQLAIVMPCFNEEEALPCGAARRITSLRRFARRLWCFFWSYIGNTVWTFGVRHVQECTRT